MAPDLVMPGRSGPASSRRYLTWISPRGMIVATVVFLLADGGDQLAGGSFFPGGPLDETAHLLTTLLVLWAIGGAVWDRLLIPALIASVAIDLDHLPAELGYDFLTKGTPRPYTHSLLTIVLVLVAALLWTRRRELLLAVALGVAIHLWRDMAEPGSGVSLLWPFSDASFSLSHLSYLVVMALVIAVGMRRSIQRSAVASIPPGTDL
jgi:inner membrane protein